MSRIRELLCRLFGHPAGQRIIISLCERRHEGEECGPGEVVLEYCGRCDENLVNRLKEAP